MNPAVQMCPSNTFTFTADQQKAYDQFGAFIADASAQYFVLEGFAGTGKSTLVKYLVEALPNFYRMARLLNPKAPTWETTLTATTNKACEALERQVGQEVTTIHSLLGLIVRTDYSTGKVSLTQRKGTTPPEQGYLVFVDEAGFVDSPGLLEWIKKLLPECKIVFIGDPAQLIQVKSKFPPVFTEGFRQSHGRVYHAQLSEVVRQDGQNQILDVSTKFRNTVMTGEFFTFRPNGKDILHLQPEDFKHEVLREFGRKDWHSEDSKVLAWRNKTVDRYNRAIRETVQGAPEISVGDNVICNRAMTTPQCRVRTDEMVTINSMDPTSMHGVHGWEVRVNHSNVAFLPESLEARADAVKKAKADGNLDVLADIDMHWIDLRAAYACTVNKSQGSTYNRVFIDVSDIGRCNNGNQIARMLYVAVSRARYQVILTGDLGK